ncbi:MAG TPA: thiamine diphosphokinase [Firmicutes bacterium]|nr:thiamine diphosphokinase [Bacillota bacterium]
MGIKSKKGILVGGGPINKGFLRKELESGYDLLMAVDGGGKPLYDLGYIPNIMLGDFDSLPPRYREFFADKGAELFTYQREKDWTDLELGMDLALSRKIEEIQVFGGLGGRLDHTLANLSLLYKAKLQKTEAIMIGSEQIVTFLAPKEHIIITPFLDGHFSLLPYSSTVKGVSIAGAKYPLRNVTIELGSTRGVHNEFIATPVEIQIDSGYLLLIVEGLKHWPGGREIFQRPPA